MQLNKNQELFTKSVVEFEKQLYEILDKQLNKFYKVQKSNRSTIYNIVAKIMFDNEVQDAVLVLTKLQQAQLHDKVSVEIQKLLKIEVEEEKILLEKLLKDMTLDMYNYNQYLTKLGIDFTLKVLGDKELKRIINTKIKSEIWSDRLWDNKDNLNKLLQDKILKFMNGEINVNNIKFEIEKLYNRSAYEVKRLVDTETSKCIEGANETFAKENGEYQLFMATLDGKTSEKCRGYDGKVYKVDDTNKPVTPLHPFCRSTLVLIPSEEWRPNSRRDNNTKELTDYKIYKEWSREQGLV